MTGRVVTFSMRKLNFLNVRGLLIMLNQTLLATVILAAVMPVTAAPIFLDFEKSPLEGALAGSLYKDDGVMFTDNAYTLHSFLIDPKPQFGGSFIRYSDLSSKAALFLSSSTGSGPSDFFINVAAGFSGTFKMIYTTTLLASDTNFVQVLDGEGKELKSGSLFKQADCIDPTGAPKQGVYCTWGEIALDFTGVAKSVHIGGNSGGYFFDNMTFGPLATTPPGTDIPEPGGIALSLAALGALAWTRKRYQR